jgi:hypothetical protein
MNIYTREEAREKVVKGRATDVETFEFVETLLKKNISKLPGAAPQKLTGADLQGEAFFLLYHNLLLKNLFSKNFLHKFAY